MIVKYWLMPPLFLCELRYISVPIKYHRLTAEVIDALWNANLTNLPSLNTNKLIAWYI